VGDEASIDVEIEVLAMSRKPIVKEQDAKACQPKLGWPQAVDAEEVLRERLARLDAGEPGISAKTFLSRIRQRLEFEQGQP
jgi:hypothetical protein